MPLQPPSPLPQAAPGALELRLLNEFQRDFPLTARPYAEVARRLAVDEATVLQRLQQLRHRGMVSRIGAVFRPNVVGVSALAALSVPIERLDEVAARVSAMAAVNHNYQREHHYNLWFVATCASAGELQTVFQTLAAQCQCGAPLVLPLLEQFHIDLGFCLAPPPGLPKASPQPPAPAVQAITLSRSQQQLVQKLQHGIALTTRPFAQLGWAEADAIELLGDWSARGVISRFGVIVRHHELGYGANAMVVWDVPDAQVSALGRALASSGAVSLCYRRPRVLPHWPYNLFCMLHGKSRQEVQQRLTDLTQRYALAPFAVEVLFSGQRFKQRGARYVADDLARPLTSVAHGCH